MSNKHIIGTHSRSIWHQFDLKLMEAHLILFSPLSCPSDVPPHPSFLPTLSPSLSPPISYHLLWVSEGCMQLSEGSVFPESCLPLTITCGRFSRPKNSQERCLLTPYDPAPTLSPSLVPTLPPSLPSHRPSHPDFFPPSPMLPFFPSCLLPSL